MIRGVLLILFIGCISSHTKAQYLVKNNTTLLNKTHAQRTMQLWHVHKRGFNNLDSITVFNEINAIAQLAVQHKDEDLLLETELLKLQYYGRRRAQYEKDFIIDEITRVDQLAKTKGVVWLEIHTQRLLAVYFYNHLREYSLGFEYYTHMEALLKKVTVADFPLKLACLLNMAGALYLFEENEKVVNILSEEANAVSPLNDSFYGMRISNLTGLSYRNLGRLDTSNHHFENALRKAIKLKDTIWIGICNGNIGENHFLEGQFGKAKPLLEKDAKTSIQYEQWGPASNALVLLSKIALENKNLPKADSLIQQASYYAHKSKYRLNQKYQRLAKVYPVQSKIASYLSQPELASTYLDSTFIVTDSIAKRFDNKKLIRAEQRIQLEKQKQKEARLKQENSRRLLLRNGMIMGLVALVGIGLLFYNRRLLLAKNKEQKLTLENTLALQKLEATEKRLSAYKQSVFNKSKLIEQLQESAAASKDQNVTAIEQLEQSAILTDKDWREFKSTFEQVHSGFIERLKQQHPKLTPAEIRFATLSRLHLSTNEMALMQGVSLGAIRQVRRRFLKSTDLQNKEVLADFITNL